MNKRQTQAQVTHAAALEAMAERRRCVGLVLRAIGQARLERQPQRLIDKLEAIATEMEHGDIAKAELEA